MSQTAARRASVRPVALLHVEDEADDRLAFERFVHRRGFAYDVDPVASVGEATTRLRRNTYDIVLADYRLPDGDALDLMPHAGETPVVVITALSSAHSAVSAMRAGAWDFLIKDSGGDYLALIPPTVEKVLARSRAELAASRGRESEKAYRELDRFLNAVTEALRIPLGSGLHFLRLAAASAPEDRLLSSYHASTISTLERALELIDGMRDFAQFSRNIEMRVIDLDAVLDTVLLESPLPSSISIERTPLGMAHADGSMVGMVFKELLANVARHAPGAERVEVSSRQCGSDVEVCIRDDGPNTDAEDPPGVFRPFDAHGLAGRGGGLGLTMCEKMVHRMGGAIWVSTGPGHAIKFTLRMR